MIVLFKVLADFALQSSNASYTANQLDDELKSRQKDRPIHNIISYITYLTACGPGADSF